MAKPYTLAGACCVHLGAVAVVSILTASPALAQQRSAAAHVHGSSSLTIAAAGTTLEMRLVAPGADIVGFERAAGSADERAALAAALDRLEDPLALFLFTPDAACAVSSASVAFTAEDADGHDEDGHDHDEDEAHDDEHEGDDDDGDGHDHADEHHSGDDDDDHAHSGHAEFIADYRFDCPGLAGVNGIDFAILAAFPGMQAIDVQVVREGRVGQFTVTPGQPRHSF